MGKTIMTFPKGILKYDTMLPVVFYLIQNVKGATSDDCCS